MVFLPRAFGPQELRFESGKELLMKRANARSRGLLAIRPPLISLECVIEEVRNSPDN